jgi:membrane-associated phospholipid phosphatase
MMKRFSLAIQIWLLCLAGCAIATILSFSRADLPIALFCSRFAPHLNAISAGLGSAVILSTEAIVVISLVFVRLIRGRLPLIAEALAIACLTSICTYAINTSALKLYFGVPTPSEVIHGARHAFNFSKGTWDSSFPSGHMALAAAFSGVIMRLYRVSVWPLTACLLLAACLLIAGNWHFLSDVIAGAFVGTTAGLLAGELWRVHSENDPPRGVG